MIQRNEKKLIIINHRETLTPEERKAAKIVIIFGEKQSGKLTLINGIVNHMNGVFLCENERLKVVDLPENRISDSIQEYHIKDWKKGKGPMILVKVNGVGNFENEDSISETDSNIITELSQYLLKKCGSLAAIFLVFKQSQYQNLNYLQKILYRMLLEKLGANTVNIIHEIKTFCDDKIEGFHINNCFLFKEDIGSNFKTYKSIWDKNSTFYDEVLHSIYHWCPISLDQTKTVIKLNEVLTNIGFQLYHKFTDWDYSIDGHESLSSLNEVIEKYERSGVSVFKALSSKEKLIWYAQTCMRILEQASLLENSSFTEAENPSVNNKLKVYRDMNLEILEGNDLLKKIYKDSQEHYVKFYLQMKNIKDSKTMPYVDEILNLWFKKYMPRWKYQLDDSKLPQISEEEILYTNGNLIVKRLQMRRLNPNQYQLAIKIMLFGETGAGKTTLLNLFANYFMNVKFDSSVRYKVQLEEDGENEFYSQTKEVKEYHFIDQDTGTPFVIIDTPGFGDTKGIQSDEKIKRQIEEYLMKSENIHAIVFVMKATETRLTSTQKYIRHCLVQSFGKDIETNLFPLLTFSDPKKSFALKFLEIPFKSSYKINNGNLFTPLEGPESDQIFAKRMYDKAMNEIKTMVDTFRDIQPVSLDKTKEVLDLREIIKIWFGRIKENVKKTLTQLENIYTCLDQLRQYQKSIETNKKVILIKKIEEYQPSPSDNTNLNCPKCKTTCHDSCSLLFNVYHFFCTISYVKCGVCGCACYDHVKENAQYVLVQRTQEIEFELPRSNESISNDQKNLSAFEQFIFKKRLEYQESREELMRLVTRGKFCLQKLNEIALDPSQRGFNDYVDMLIEEEKKNEDKSSKEIRVSELENLKVDEEKLLKMAEEHEDEYTIEFLDDKACLIKKQAELKEMFQKEK